MPTQKLKVLYRELKDYTSYLATVVKDSEKEIFDIMEGRKELIANCPSRASGAEIVYRQVKKRSDEVQSLVEQVNQAIFREGQP